MNQIFLLEIEKVDSLGRILFHSVKVFLGNSKTVTET